MIICCNCFFHQYFFRINKENDFSEKLRSNGPFPWSVLDERLTIGPVLGGRFSFDYQGAIRPVWFSRDTCILFHVCIKCLTNVFDITVDANDTTVDDVFRKTCCFADRTWFLEYDYDLNKSCEECLLKLCFKVVKDMFNILDKTHIIKE